MLVITANHYLNNPASIVRGQNNCGRAPVREHFLPTKTSRTQQ